MLCLAPQSSATTLKVRPARGWPRSVHSPRPSRQVLPDVGLTQPARFWPAIEGRALAMATSSSSVFAVPTKRMPRSAPLMRRIRTSARVSIPSMPMTPLLASHSESPATARWLLGSRIASRTTKPATAAERLSPSSVATP